MIADEIYQAALTLPDESEALLAERLAAYLETNMEPEVETQGDRMLPGTNK